KERVVVGELDWESLETHAAEVKRYLPLPRFPGVERDLAVVVPETVPAEAVQECVRQVAGKFLESVGVFDVYRGAQIPAGHKSLALGMVYRHPERTFTDAEVDQIEEAVIKELEERLGAKLRKADGL
ncbi:MAG: phenylalanine--tRNA ligase subunit beta, partial [Clostridia bacterium]|nr:phenylalanine--tRNA ligase subunit beta [Clostridia bacterium]